MSLQLDYKCLFSKFPDLWSTDSPAIKAHPGFASILGQLLYEGLSNSDGLDFLDFLGCLGYFQINFRVQTNEPRVQLELIQVLQLVLKIDIKSFKSLQCHEHGLNIPKSDDALGGYRDEQTVVDKQPEVFDSAVLIRVESHRLHRRKLAKAHLARLFAHNYEIVCTICFEGCNSGRELLQFLFGVVFRAKLNDLVSDDQKQIFLVGSKPEELRGWVSELLPGLIFL